MQARLRHAYLFTVIAVALTTVLGETSFAQPNNPFVGIWKLNVAKSTYSPGPAPQSSTTQIELVSAGLKYTVDQVTATGGKQHWEFSGNYDGRDNLVAGDNPNGDTVALIRVNDTTVRQVNKKNGRVTVTQVAVVSSDGKTRTLTTTGINLEGQTVNNVAVYEKQ